MKICVLITSFLMALLLFAVQPMATKMVLPAFGGTPAVWNTAMFTFQFLLLLGYLYAHGLVRYIPQRFQLATHALILLASIAFLPLAIHLPTSAELVEHPIYYLTHALLTQLGLPFFFIAATAPLLQSWVSRSQHALSEKPYVLYSASNLGSFSGLIGYIVIADPFFDLSEQRNGWSLLYFVAGALLLLTGKLLNFGDAKPLPSSDSRGPDWKKRVMWIALAFIPSSLSLGVTTYITTDVASAPLLWVLPLSIYLLSFVDAFSYKPIAVRVCQRIAPILGVTGMMAYAYGIVTPVTANFFVQMGVFTVYAFAFHGLLSTLKPPAAFLTQFYVCLSVGGAVGGLFNGLAAPVLFNGAYEYPCVLLLATFISFCVFQNEDGAYGSIQKQLGSFLLITGKLIVLCIVFYHLFGLWMPAATEKFNFSLSMKALTLSGILLLLVYRQYNYAFYTAMAVSAVALSILMGWINPDLNLYKGRNFFGSSTVFTATAVNGERINYHKHDTTIHGIQSQDRERKMQPLAYYSGLREPIRLLPVISRKPLAIMGLGVGTLKCFASKGQQVDIYEINPMSREIAENPDYFTYLRDCPGKAEIFMGDGRIRMAEKPAGRYGAIILDAFSSDAIPMHLLTREAFDTYMDKLSPGGVIFTHITNRHINLRSQLEAQAKSMGIVSYYRAFERTEKDALVYKSQWVLFARKKEDLNLLLSRSPEWQEPVAYNATPWTDHYMNILPYIHVSYYWE